MFATIMVGLLACSLNQSLDDTQTGDTNSTATEDTAQDTQTGTEAKGCLRGRVRDVNNNSAPDLQVDVFDEAICEPLGGTVSEADGSFCLGGLPVNVPIVVQATFVGRCAWTHSKTITIPITGTCEFGTCAALETWFECEGDSAICS